jgi:hypothetical protein
MLVVDRESHHVAYGLDALNKFQRRNNEKEDLAICPKVKCVMLGMINYAPLRMSAFERLGASTISSTAFFVGNVCRDKRVYDSACALLEL